MVSSRVIVWMLMTRLLLFVVLAALQIAPALAKEFLVYFGTYTPGKSRGISVSRLDTATGKLTPPTLAAETVNPSFVAIHPNRKFLYAVSEVPELDGQRTGAVSAFSIDPTSGKLTFLNR